MKYEVIDNFLDEDYFDRLVILITDKEKTGNRTMPWYFQSSITYPEDYVDYVVPDKSFYMTHVFYENNAPISNLYEILLPLLNKLEIRCLLRVKANLYPNTEILHENPMHKDYNFCHSGAIFSLNTCDGYTTLKDGTKIDSVANRILLFDPGEKHCSSTTTNVSARININMNYIQEQT